MKPGHEPTREPDALLTRFASQSPALRVLSDWLDMVHFDRQPLGFSDCFAEAEQAAAKERDLADRNGLAGRNVLVREPEAFELFGRGAGSWLADMKALGLPLDVERDMPSGALVSAQGAYVVVVARIDRAGRKLGKLLCPRIKANGPLPVDEAGAMAWAMIPSVERWGTASAAHLAKPVSTAGSRYLGDGFDDRGAS